VSQTAGQLPDGFHLLRLVQALGGQLAFRDIDNLHHKLLDFRLLAPDHGNAG